MKGPAMLIAHFRNRFMEAFLPKLSEWTAAGILFALGLMLANNHDLMDPSKPGYRGMLNIANQETWSVLMLLGGSARLTILIINGAWHKSPHARAIGAFMTCYVWFQILLSFQPIAGFGFVFATGIWLMDTINVLRATRDARTVDNVIRSGVESGGLG